MTRTLGRVAGSVAALAVATGLVYALRPIAPTLSLGVLYTLAVLAAATLWGLGYALAVALASMLAFNFLFLAPVHTLTLADGRNWTALAVYLVTAVVASQLATQARRRAAEAQQREREAALLSDAAAALLQEAPLDEIQVRAELVLAGGDEAAQRRFEAALESLLALSAGRREAEVVRRSDAIKTAILHSVSHDFRTPLATMQTALDGLQSGDLQVSDADRAELLDTIRSELDRLTRLVGNLLDLSRLQAGIAAPHPSLWSVDDLMARALDEVGRSARVRLHVPDDVPVARVDDVQIQRALVNLMHNALKFSDGPVDVTVQRDGEDVVIDVLDRGAGIVSADDKGTGLGLAIARGFATVNGGAVSLADREGGGTTASLRLPGERIPASVAP